MNVGDERSRSVWMNVAGAPDAKPLDGDASADTVVVGSGIAGLSTAYELAARGQTVIVLDRGAIGSGMTARTTAHLTSLCDDSFDSLINKRGVDVAKQFYLSLGERHRSDREGPGQRVYRVRLPATGWILVPRVRD